MIDRKFKQSLKKSFAVFLGIVALLVGIKCHISAGTTPKSTENLRAFERNLDILADKSGSLHQLIEQLQRQEVYYTSGVAAGSGGNILIPGLATDDHILAVTVYSSANVVNASTTTGFNVNSATLVVTSRLYGDAGNAIELAVTTQQSSTSFQVRDLVIVTTGTKIEVKLASNAVTQVGSSVAAVANALNAHPVASKLVKAAYLGTGQGIMSAMGSFRIGTGTAGSGTGTGRYSISPSFFTISSTGTVSVSTEATVNSVDVLGFSILNTPDTQ